jgi:hypothetical protein
VIGQLPPEFFQQFFAILQCSPAQALRLEEGLNDVCQRQWFKAQLDVLPQMERETFGKIVEQDGVSVSTVNEFLEQRLDQNRRLQLWEEAQLKVWSEVLDLVGKSATEQQRKEIKELIRHYKGS